MPTNILDGSFDLVRQVWVPAHSEFNFPGTVETWTNEQFIAHFGKFGANVLCTGWTAITRLRLRALLKPLDQRLWYIRDGGGCAKAD